MPLKIAIQGGQASFHDMAVRQYFTGRSVELCECRTFRQQCFELVENNADCAVMAIENSLSGSFLPNYTLLQEFPLRITGEIYLHIQQNLIALSGQTLSDIQSIHSHPMALHQCSNLLDRHPQILCVETFDTAESAKEISEKKLKGIAAIASTLAAELYGLNVLAESIENIKDNYTRFLVLTTEKGQKVASPDKASLSFHVRHEVGALAEALNIFQEHSVNLGLIQSIPIPCLPDEYEFHVDLEWQNRMQFDQAIEQIREIAIKLEILGEYKSGVKPYASKK